MEDKEPKLPAVRSIAWLGLGVLIDNHYRETSSPTIRDQR
jgi:hypothetical protein